MKKQFEKVFPKKHLGQHFLIDEDVAINIVNALMHEPGIVHVLEIGPGMGVLTKYLLQHPIQLELIEIDVESVNYLNNNFPTLQANIIREDFLKLDFSRLNNPIAVIGNFPYQISTQILFKILAHKDQVNVVVGMFQKEVASRIAAPPGNKEYGIPSVLLQAWFDIEYLFSVEHTKFNPPPKVQSGVIRLIRNSRTDLGCDEKTFTLVVKQAFNYRRKTLRNSLRGLIQPEKLDALPYASLRPEQLSWQQFAELANFVNS